jgi:SpoVK/Ycf46/Vps4 family AAA+-type ATPase
MKSKFVGESEATLRKALKVIESVGKCVVWIDEIEKALQGATSGSADGGVSSDALGTILSWMQDRQGDAFVVATANDVTALPPELLRKGRFDEVWFVDLPNSVERVAVLAAALKTNNRDAARIDMGAVSAATNGYTGSEIAALVPDAMFAAFADGEREISTKDLLAAAEGVVPLSMTADAKIKALKEWGATRARQASAQIVADTKAGRVLDIAS